jgi:excisionase family DNA binding protein
MPSGSPGTAGQSPISSDSILSVWDSSFSLGVGEAAGRLGVTPLAVRQQIASGRLPAVKRGRDWWLDAQAFERMARQPPPSGRPLSPAMAWAVMLLASGEDAAAKQVAGRDRYWSRARGWLREHPLGEHAARLRARAQLERFDAHPSERKRILSRPDVMATGASAADVIGLVGSPSGVEVYAPAGRRDAVLDEHALMPGPGPVLVRWVPDALWSHLLGERDRRAPRAAVLLDLLESDEPRARREAARALAS